MIQCRSLCSARRVVYVCVCVCVYAVCECVCVCVRALWVWVCVWYCLIYFKPNMPPNCKRVCSVNPNRHLHSVTPIMGTWSLRGSHDVSLPTEWRCRFVSIANSGGTAFKSRFINSLGCVLTWFYSFPPGRCCISSLKHTPPTSVLFLPTVNRCGG
jgi:hypothetical protein